MQARKREIYELSLQSLLVCLPIVTLRLQKKVLFHRAHQLPVVAPRLLLTINRGCLQDFRATQVMTISRGDGEQVLKLIAHTVQVHVGQL